MPIVTVEQITRPEELVEYLAQLIDASNLGLKYIAKYDESLIPDYPAVRIMSSGIKKEIHATHTWLLTLRADIYVFHAKLTQDRQTRNYNDLVLATNLVAYLEQDLTLGKRVINGWVTDETPGVSPPRSTQSEAIISTKLSWSGIQEARF